MLVLWFVSVSLHVSHKRCYVRAAHQYPRQRSQEASVPLVQLSVAILVWMRDIQVLGVNLAELQHVVIL
eukprot:9087236-Prorocentrum_lima.AAC.1